jgi:hypothetical protein
MDPERETRRLIAKLEALGHQVSLSQPPNPGTPATPRAGIPGQGSLPRAS